MKLRDVQGTFVAHADLATAYAAIPGKPVMPVAASVAWAQNGPTVLAGERDRF